MYTDKELKEMTQIAYRDFGGANDILSGKNSPGRASNAEPQPLIDLVNQEIAKDPSSMDALDMDMINSHPDWKMIATFDDNANSGFYACLVETEPGKLVIAFRGSESLTDAHHRKTDWGDADLGLLGSIETTQHEQVRRMFENKEFQAILSRYDHVAMTGHSLGGNLAEYATIMSAKYGFDYKVDQCVSFDGPGFSDEFLQEYADEINQVSGKMTHYQWSVVGMLLHMVPGVDYRHVKVNNSRIPGLRHSTEGLVFDENGKLKSGKYNKLDLTALGLKHLSLFLEEYFAGKNAPRNLLILGLQFALLGPGALAIRMIGDTVKTVYQELKKWIQSIIHRDADYFRVNTGALDRDVGSVRAAINSVRKNVDEMFASVQGLNGMWTGPANKAFTAKFVSEKESISNYLAEIERHVARLESDAAAYNRCEQRAVSMV